MRLSAQECANDHFSISYEGQGENSIVRSIFTPKNELVSIGGIDHSKNGLFFVDGWVSKFTSHGSVIWSRRYTAEGYNILQFRDIVLCSDSGYLLVGYEQNIDSVNFNVEGWGVLLKLDLYGNIVWSKSLKNHFNAVAEYNLIENIFLTGDHDFILNAVSYNRFSKSSRSIILRINENGQVTWATSLTSIRFEFKYNLNKSIIETVNNKLIFAGLIDERIVRNDSIVRSGFYFFSLDALNGSMVWDKTYIIRSRPSNVFFSTSSVQHVSELKNGDLSFIAYVDTFPVSIPPLTSRAANIITDKNGSIKKIVTYQYAERGLYTIDAKNFNNDLFVLMYDGKRPVLMQTSEDGRLTKQNAYADLNGLSEPASLSVTSLGNYFYINDKTKASVFHLVKTNAGGDSACVSSPLEILSENGKDFISQDDAQMQIKPLTETSLFTDISILGQKYILQSDNDCIKSCCSDFVDYSNPQNIQLCEGSSFVLPDNHIIKDSGTYYVSYKTAKGCDSIRFYNISLIKNPQSLIITSPLCMDKNDSIVIHATPGFSFYDWTNIQTKDSVYIVKKPGIYWVSVSNSCGFKKETVTITRECDFSVRMPNAFTPNGDGINDIFRIPSSNKNKIIRFIIYNRWGQKIFETSDMSKGWNGTYNGKNLPSGSFIFSLTISGSDKKLFFQQGVFTLIR